MRNVFKTISTPSKLSGIPSKPPVATPLGRKATVKSVKNSERDGDGGVTLLDGSTFHHINISACQAVDYE